MYIHISSAKGGTKRTLQAATTDFNVVGAKTALHRGCFRDNLGSTNQRLLLAPPGVSFIAFFFMRSTLEAPPKIDEELTSEQAVSSGTSRCQRSVALAATCDGQYRMIGRNTIMNASKKLK